MRKILFLIATLMLFAPLTILAQQSKFYADVALKKGVGFKTYNLSYSYITIPTSQKIYYHPGGGTGIEAGFGYRFSNSFSVGLQGAYQLVFIEKVENLGSAKNRSAAVFNRKTVKGYIRYFLPANNREWLSGVFFDAGGNYHFPGKLKRKQNGEQLETRNYDSSIGFHIGPGLLFSIAPEKNIDFKFGLTFRFTDFQANHSNEDSPNLDKIDGSGLDIKLGIVKTL